MQECQGFKKETDTTVQIGNLNVISNVKQKEMSKIAFACKWPIFLLLTEQHEQQHTVSLVLKTQFANDVVDVLFSQHLSPYLLESRRTRETTQFLLNSNA